MKKMSRRSKIWTWIGGVLLVIVLIVAAVASYLSKEWKPLLGQHLKDLVLESTDSLYRVEYDSFDLNLVTGNAGIKHFRLLPDTAVYKRMLRENKAPDNLYELRVNEVVIQNFHPKLLYSQKKLNINDILVDNPKLLITNNRQPYNDTVPVQKGKPKTLYQVISKVFKQVKVNHIALRDIDFTFVNRSNVPVKQNSVRNLNVNISDILIDSLAEKDPNRLYSTRNVEVLMSDYRLATADSLYYLNFKNIGFSTEGRKLSIDQISLQPRYTIPDYYKKVRHRKDRFNVVFNDVLLRGMDLHRFSRDQKLYAKSFNFNNARVEVYNTNAWPPGKKVIKTGNFPHQQLQKLALDLKIDTLNLKNTLISYSEYNTLSGQTGKLTFNRMAGRIYNVTNDSVALSKNHKMKAFITAYLMNVGRMDVKFVFDLSDKKGAFTYAGTIGSMSGVELNKITRPLGMLEVNTADMKTLRFDAKASELGAFGTMQFYYNNLNVKVLAKDEKTGEVKKQGLLSKIANVFILHKDNPDSKGRLTSGTIRYLALPGESFFGVLWKGLFSGIKESVGVSAEREVKLKKTATTVGNIIGGIKKKLEDRKERRQQRKEERKVKKALKEQEKSAKQKAETP